MGIDIRDVYVKLERSANPLIRSESAGFSSDGPGVLVSFLEIIGITEAPDAFSQSGLWISIDQQFELVQSLVSIIRHSVDEHRIDCSNACAMFDHFGNLPRTLETYIDEYFPLKKFLDPVLEALDERWPEVDMNFAEGALRALAYELLKRGTVPFFRLLEPVADKLRRCLIENDRIPEQNDRGHEKTSAAHTGLSEVDTALSALGFSPAERPDTSAVKRRYKELMKRYHPDVNPRGLERSKQINQALGILLSILRQRN